MRLILVDVVSSDIFLNYVLEVYLFTNVFVNSLFLINVDQVGCELLLIFI